MINFTTVLQRIASQRTSKDVVGCNLNACTCDFVGVLPYRVNVQICHSHARVDPGPIIFRGINPSNKSNCPTWFKFMRLHACLIGSSRWQMSGHIERIFEMSSSCVCRRQCWIPYWPQIQASLALFKKKWESLISAGNAHAKEWSGKAKHSPPTNNFFFSCLERRRSGSFFIRFFLLHHHSVNASCLERLYVTIEVVSRIELRLGWR